MHPNQLSRKDTDMTKGIRDFVNAAFARHLPELKSGKKDGKAFRAAVMGDAQKKFGITVASAATHYNHALKMQRETDPKSVEGLGRPEDKKGGRPVLNPVTVVNARSGRAVAEGISRGAANDMIKQAGTYANGQPKLVIQAEEEATA
jgi:hypothetical protein